MRRVCAALFALACALCVAPGSARATSAPGDCDGAPDGWSEVTTASGFSGTVLVCNYRVSRTIGDRHYESGAAITLEFYCASSAARQAYRGKTGKRDTEISRTATKLVTQEGPKAKNPDNPQRDGVFSSFFPGITFGLFEKEWVLFSPPQVVGTLVTLTNEKGKVAEPKRFGVRVVEPVANTLAAANAGKVAGCKIPSNVHIPGAGGSNKSGNGGSATIPIVVGIAGVAGVVVVVVIINGRRRRGRPKFKKPRRTAKGPNVFDPSIEEQKKRWNEEQLVWDPETQTFRPFTEDDLELVDDDEPDVAKKLPRVAVPAQCQAIYDQVADSQSELAWLDRTIAESQKYLAKLELEFLQNRARASIQVSIDIAQGASSVVGGLTGAAKSALITNAGRSAGTAMQAMGEANTLDDLIRRRNLLSSLDNNVSVNEARQLYTYWTNKANTAIADLPKANLARTAYAEAQALEKARATRVYKQASIRDPLVSQISGIEGEIAHLEARAASQLGPMEQQLQNLELQIKRTEPTLGPRGSVDTGPMDAGRAQRLAELQGRKTALTNEMDALRNSERLVELRSQLTQKQGQLVNASQGWDEINKAWDEARAAKENAFIRIYQLEDVTAADVAKLKDIQSHAFARLAAAELAARSSTAGELADLDAKIAAVRAALAKLAEAGPAPSLPVRAVNTVVGPLVNAWQKAFGAGDTPQEMLDILLKYKAAILTERANLIRNRSVRDDLRTAALPALTHALEACLKANAPTPLRVPKLSN